MIMTITLRLIGRNSFQVRYIRLSYRIRGMVARTQMKIVATIMVFSIKKRFVATIDSPVKNTIDSKLIIKILAYSAMKIKANIPLLYSTLNPETSSDSPSAKSNGVRLVSARLVINHIIAKGMIISIIHEIVEEEIRDISICLWRIKAVSRINDILTS